MTTIYLIRHGEVHNPNNILYARLPDFRLSERGREEASQTAEFLMDKHIDILYSSPLLRAKQTAEIIQKKLGIEKIHISEEITEVRTSYQGKKFSDLDELQSEVFLKPLDPTDETILHIAERMQNFITGLIKTYADKHIAVVSHGDPIMAIKAVIKKRSLEFYSFKTDQYIQHAEVYEIMAADESENLSIKPVFQPQI